MTTPNDEPSSLIIVSNAAFTASLIRQARAAVLPTSSQCTVALVSEVRGGHDLGTGVLVEIADRPMIFTAAHVLEDAARSGGGVFVGVAGGKTIDLGGNDAIVNTNPNQAGRETIGVTCSRDGDRMDIAHVVLRPDQAAVFREGGYTFLRQHKIWTGYEPSQFQLVGGLFVLHGYPTALAKMSEGNRVFAPSTMAVLRYLQPPGIRYPHEILLEYPDKYDERLISGDGQRVAPFEAHGLSGCGIWSVPHALLVGILHTWDEKNGVVRGTETPALVAGAVEKDPELAQALALITRPF